MKVDGQVVDNKEVGAGKEERVNATEPDRALPEQAPHYSSSLALKILPYTERDQDDGETDNQANYVATIPHFGLPTILQSQDLRHDSARDHGRVDEVHLKQLLFLARLDRLSAARSVKNSRIIRPEILLIGRLM